MREIVLDTETTGLDKNNDRIIEIGAIELINKTPSGKRLHKYINPKILISKAAYKVHGISNSFLNDKPTFSDIADELSAFLGSAKIVAHNASFDVGFINNEMKNARNSFKIEQKNVVCTMKLASSWFPGSRVNLNALCKRFKIDISNRALHGALKDAQLLMQVYYYMTGLSQANLTNENNEQNMQRALQRNKKISNNQNATKHRLKTVKPLSEEEKAHKDMLKEIQNNLWN